MTALWTLQLVPGIALLLAGLASGGWDTQLWKTSAAIGVASLWIATTLVVVGTPRGRGWLREHRFQLVLAAGSAVVATIVLDVGLTITGIVPTLEAQRSRSISYSLDRQPRTRLIPQDVTIGDQRIFVNDRGLRSPAIDTTRQDDERRVLVLGGSQVFDSLGNWPGRLETSLQKTRQDVRVLNAGVPGHNSLDSVEKLLADFWLLRPDVVVVCQTWNDLKYFTRLTDHRPLRGFPPLVPKSWHPDGRLYPSGLDRLLSVSSIHRNFRWAWARRFYGEEGVRATRAPDQLSAEDIAGSDGLEQFRLNFEVIAYLTKLIDAELVLCKQTRLLTRDGSGDRQEMARDYVTRNTRLTPETLIAAYDACHEVIDAIGERHGAVVVDMDRKMTGKGEYFTDGIHFNATGAQFAAEMVSAAIAPLIAPGDSPQER